MLKIIHFTTLVFQILTLIIIIRSVYNLNKTEKQLDDAIHAYLQKNSRDIIPSYNNPPPPPPPPIRFNKS